MLKFIIHLGGNKMKTKKLFSIFLLLGIMVTSFGFDKPDPAKKNAINTDLVITNLLNGINSENQGLRVSSAYFLGELKSDKAVIPLMKILKSDENEESRIMAALSLIKIGDLRGIYAVKQAIKYDQSERVNKLCLNFYRDYMSPKQLESNSPILISSHKSY